LTSNVIKYLDAKKIDYQLDGNNALFNCPFCDDSEQKFGINIENWLGQCFKGKCATKVNEITFKRKFGDVIEHKSNLEDDEPEPKAATKTKPIEDIPNIEAHHAALLADDELMNYLNDERGFSMETIKDSKLGLSKRNFGNGPVRALTFPYFSKGKCTGVKYKSIAPEVKDFRFTKGRDVGLYRVDNIKKDMEYLIIAEGETDVMMLLQAGYTNVVGISGCDAKKMDWADLLELPKKLYLVLDNDEAGLKGAKAFTARFGVERFNIVNIPHYDLDVPITDKHGTRTTISDVNEFFHTGHTKEEFDALLDSARPFDIEGVTTMDEAFDNIIKNFGDTGSFLPEYKFKWDSINQIAKGKKKGDLIVFLAPAKCGKTTWCLNDCEFMAEQYGISPHFDCMEMTGDDLTKKWTAMKLGVDEDDLTLAQMQEGKRLAKSRPNQFIFTRSHPTTLDEYLTHLRRIKRRYDSGIIVVDNFQILVDLTIGRNNSNNRPAYMSQVSKSLKALAHELQVPLVLISQPKQLQEDKMVGVNDSEGSSTLTKDADLFFTANRNPEVKMKLAQMESIGKLETNQSHSENMYIELGLSRRSAGGFRTLKIDGAKSLIREFDDTETTAGQKKIMAGGIQIIDDNEKVEV